MVELWGVLADSGLQLGGVEGLGWAFLVIWADELLEREVWVLNGDRLHLWEDVVVPEESGVQIFRAVWLVWLLIQRIALAQSGFTRRLGVNMLDLSVEVIGSVGGSAVRFGYLIEMES